MANLSSQFDFTGEQVHSRSNPRTFAATEHGDDDPVGTVKYKPPTEKHTFEHANTRVMTFEPIPGGIAERGSMAYNPHGDLPQQGVLVKGTAARVDMLATHPDHRGIGLGGAMVDLAIDEHQRRFGHNSFPKAATFLSADSAGMVTHLTGKHHEQMWGTGMDSSDESFQGTWGVSKEDAFAVDTLKDVKAERRGDTERGHPWQEVAAPSGISSRLKPVSQGPQFSGQIPGQQVLPGM